MNTNMNTGFNTYRILAVPKNFNGIVDLRPFMYNPIARNKVDENTCFIFDNIGTVEAIRMNLGQYTRNTNYKFCQLEPIQEGAHRGFYPIVPNFIKIKNKLNNGLATFDIESVKYKDLPISDNEKQFFINEKYLKPLQLNFQNAKQNAQNAMYKEWKGDKIAEIEKQDVIKNVNDAENQIKNFDYTKFMNDDFKAEF